MMPTTLTTLLAATLAVLLVQATEHGFPSKNRPASPGNYASFPGPWDRNILSPASRHVEPTRVLDEQHKVLSGFSKSKLTNLNSDSNPQAIFDFGKEVGGIMTVKYSASGSGRLGVAFTEALNFTGPVSDMSNGGTGSDGALYAEVSASETMSGSYSTPVEKQRGGFRYATLFVESNSTLTVNITDVVLEISFQPNWSNLRAYGGYFHSSDELLNKIWYASAYTIQTTTIPPDSGRVWPNPSEGWLNNADLQVNGSSVLVDGAKRDRAVWAGDLGIAVPSTLVSTGDYESAKNAIQVQYDFQNQETGELPMVTPPIGFYGSDTYHLITMIATYDYVLYSNDVELLKKNENGYKKAMAFITNKIDDTGLLNVTGASNWGRKASDAGHSTDGNALMYGALMSGVTLAEWLGDTASARRWEAIAMKLKFAMNSQSKIWDSAKGAFKNTATDASIYPQDGNGMALYFNASTPSHGPLISTYLTQNWTPIGAVTPEQPGNIVPFISGYEVKGHFVIRQTQRALDLIRRSWGWYLNNPYGTQSTMIEGYYEDGSFRYANDPTGEGSYPSHAHGWSAAPAEALVTFVVGLKPMSPGGGSWELAPQMGDLREAQGGFTTPVGRFSAGWEVNKRGYTLWYDTPGGSKGVARLPSQRGRPRTTLLDGRRMSKIEYDDTTILSQFEAPGGRHTIIVKY